ncbi:ABC transporter substrate-binding protein [Galbitalea sp. SE-J8]|uniref:ABC transporter substrate-binding protein n=1 Tax=Galbitalea sp. SE-J8 TaxID=3054952 RepID=UPI00259C9DD8|nr:ABC transporter substrate-binding protein [Galbitalea sp. SE-J8]MDM4762230.1 ABC transporter substrate-binding protein [Galbitalea sp. SE-J8]
MPFHPFRASAIRRGAVVALAAATATALLAGCSSSADPTSDDSAGPIAVSYQTSWLPSVDWAGSYLADEDGYFADHGLDVDVLPGGPDIASESLVAAGTATIGTSGADNVAQANAQGADLVIVGADFQANPFEVTSLATAPLAEPSDMVGKKIGVATGNTVPFQAFLTANGLSDKDLTIVPVGFDLSPLTSGEVDGIVSFTSGRTVTLAGQGIDAVGMRFQDFGMPMLSHVYFTTRDELKSHRDSIVGFIAAQIQGWDAAIADPQAAVDLTMKKYGTDQGLDATTQAAQLTFDIDSMATPDDKIIWMSDDAIADSVATLSSLGIDGVSADLFDNSVVKDAYAELGDQ